MLVTIYLPDYTVPYQNCAVLRIGGGLYVMLLAVRNLNTVIPRLTAAEMKYMRITAGYIWTDYKTNTQIAKELKITPVLDKLLEYKRNWLQHVNRMPRNRLPRVMKRYSPTGRRKHSRPMKRLLDK
jgi:hypothetical protein